MPSVSGRISQIKQPYGGYLPVKEFITESFEDGLILNEQINISPILLGLAVDYLTRYMLGEKPSIAFDISLYGASLAGERKKVSPLLRRIRGLTDTSIISACKLVAYDVWYRNPLYAALSPTQEQVNPDIPTIENIRILINRNLTFFKMYGPVVKTSFEFEGGYTQEVSSGDGDYLTKDGLWDLKVRKSKITSKHTLQILMYWIMGKHSGQSAFNNITRIGFFNPHQNMAYVIDVSRIAAETIRKVETDVIGYWNNFIGDDLSRGKSHERICYEFEYKYSIKTESIRAKEDIIFYSKEKIPYIEQSRFAWRRFIMDNYGSWWVFRNKKQNNEEFETICKLAIVNNIADVIERPMPSGSTIFYIKDINPSAYARLVHFFLETGIIYKWSNGKYKDDGGGSAIHEFFSVHDFINLKTGEFKTGYEDIGNESFDLCPDNIEICEYSYEWPSRRTDL